jgi:hypothetical protein
MILQAGLCLIISNKGLVVNNFQALFAGNKRFVGCNIIRAIIKTARGKVKTNTIPTVAVVNNSDFLLAHYYSRLSKNVPDSHMTPIAE